MSARHIAGSQPTRTISASRLLPPRVLASVLSATIAALVAVSLLAPGGHDRPRSSVPVPIADSLPGACSPGSRPLNIRRAESAIHARHTALGGALDAALRAARNRARAPAVTAAVVLCGRVVWADATGVLDLGSKRPASNSSLFVLNSAAKTYVATMVMQEIQDRHLFLATRLSQFYPWLPNARQITVRMLLNMTSGLPDYLNNPRIQWMIHRRPRHHWTVDQVLTGLGTGLGPATFSPGRKYQYSDTNYIVLGAIVERITHRSIEHEFQQMIAKPLGITSATWVPSPAAEARVAHPYLRLQSGSLTSQWIAGYGVSSAVWGPVFTDGGLASSSLDVAWFANALLGGRLVRPSAVRQMAHIGRGDYGFGVRARSFDGHYWLGHRGYFGGFETEDWTDSTRQLTIAVGTNLEIAGGQPISTPMWRAIAQAYDHHDVGAS
jgi:D-alanyl-D-alanine carboxypeptidase